MLLGEQCCMCFPVIWFRSAWLHHETVSCFFLVVTFGSNCHFFKDLCHIFGKTWWKQSYQSPGLLGSPVRLFFGQPRIIKENLGRSGRSFHGFGFKSWNPKVAPDPKKQAHPIFNPKGRVQYYFGHNWNLVPFWNKLCYSLDHATCFSILSIETIDNCLNHLVLFLT